LPFRWSAYSSQGKQGASAADALAAHLYTYWYWGAILEETPGEDWAEGDEVALAWSPGAAVLR
jgi:hypothetical protein